MTGPEITVVMVPRERNSGILECIDSLYTYTAADLFRLVVVQGDLPQPVRSDVERLARLKGFDFIHTEYALRPNEARNLGLRETDTEWVLFTDNDVEFSEGWLEHMVDAGRELDAWLVTPVITHGRIADDKVHVAGPHFIEESTDGGPHHEVIQRHQFARLSEIKPSLVREYCTDVEFHVVLARTSVFDRIGPLNEQVVSKDHTDFSRDVRLAGGMIAFEPGAVVGYISTHTNPDCLGREDLPHYLLRFSDEWNAASFESLRTKWPLPADSPMQREMEIWVRKARSKGYNAVYGRRIGRLADPRTRRLGDALDRLLFDRVAGPTLEKRRATGLPV